MKLFELKELVDRLCETTDNRNLNVVLTLGEGNLDYTANVYHVEPAIWTDNGDCFADSSEIECEGEPVIQIHGSQSD